MTSEDESHAIDIGDEDSFTEGEEYFYADETKDENKEIANQIEDFQTDRIGILNDKSTKSISKQQQVLKAHISILASALGGIDYDSDSERYKLGDDALACLKDIKRWLRSVDEQDKKWDVAMACAESGLVVNDLLVILAQWETDCTMKKVKNKNYMERVMLAVVELLVPLTWPLRLTKDSTPNQVDHYPNLKKAQLLYKKHFLTFREGKALRAVVRLTLPLIYKSKAERTTRDNAVLRLCIYFFRNLLKIEPANSTVSSKAASKGNFVQDNLPTDVSLDDISLNAVIESFERNKIFSFLLTITNLLGSDFDEEMLSMGCLECLYYLVDGVNVKKVFMTLHHSSSEAKDDRPPQRQSTADLKDLLAKENNLKKAAIKSTSSRHGRFGTLLSLQTIDNGRLTISGQKGLSDRASTLSQLDNSKPWRPSRNVNENMRFTPTSEMGEKMKKSTGEKFLTTKGLTILTKFMNDFIEGCFNPLSYGLRRKFLSAEDPSFNSLQYFELISWIIGYETERRMFDKENDIHDNGYFTSVLEDDFFTLVITSMRKAAEEYKQWSLVQSCMKCFKQVLSFADLIGSTSLNPTDQLMSHNLKARLFAKEVTLDLLASLPKNAYKISPEYVITVVELTYVVLKTLEKFSKDDESLYISAKRSRKTKATNLEANDSEDEDIPSTKTKSLDFRKYQAKFIHRDTIQTHITLLERYNEVSEQDIKRCLSFFYRAFYTTERHLDLFRMDFMILLHQITGNGPKALPRSSHLKKEIISFTKYYMKKMVSSLEKAPSLFVELCFYSSMTTNSRLRYFLEKGEVLKEQVTYKVAREIFFKGGYELDLDRKFAIVVSLMIDSGETELVQTVKEDLSRIIDSMLAWQLEQQQLDVVGNDTNSSSRMLEPPTQDIKVKDGKMKTQLIRNSRLRLLLKTIGFELPESVSQSCELPSDVGTDHLTLCLGSISKYLVESVKFPDGESAIDYMTKSGYDDDDSDDEQIHYGRGNEYEEDEDDIAFETGQMNVKSHHQSELDKLDEIEASLRTQTGRTKTPLGHARRKNRKKIVTAAPNKKKARKNRYDALEMHELSDAENSVPKNLKEFEYKSSEFIDDSDDEDEGEFFAREQFLRQLLEANGGLLKPEHVKLFSDDSWKSYKIVDGMAKKRATYDKLASLDDIVKSTQSQANQEAPQDFSDANDNESQVAQINDVEVSQQSSDVSEASDGDDLNHSARVSETGEATEIEGVVSNKRRVNIQSEDEDEDADSDNDHITSRKKARRVVDSDDDE